MQIKGSRFLVIGGAGFIGSHLVDQLLEQGAELVRVYDNFSRGNLKNLSKATENPQCEIFSLGGDVRDRDILAKAMQDIDGVFHLAALWLLHCVEFPRSAFHTNIEGTFNVLEACVNAKIKRLVYSSSASVYGNAESIPMTEEHPFKNETFYGATKIAGEQMLQAMHKRYQLNYAGLRYMNVYGSRQDYKGAYIAVILKILDRIEKGLPPILHGDGQQTFDFVHVKDVARANICAMAAGANGFYNVGTGVGTSLLALCELILQLCESNLTIKYEPNFQNFVTNRIGCVKAAANTLDFEANISLESGLKELLEWKRSV